ncbi:MAG: hypothetical protein JO097_21470 [Acidobacteriaceae bacterium]|nr:hypothetical protein [Acidobacteriaceae bacterium]
MTKGQASGYTLGKADVPIVLGMAARGDRNHDIAAWFGVNQGRIAEAKEGKYGNPAAAPQNALPPSGAPGIKGRRLRSTVETVVGILSDKATADGVARAET